MKTVVSVNEISEFEIKPKAELNEWKKSVEDEINTRWPDKTKWRTVACPVCNTTTSTPAFIKSGFSYEECNQCKTLYAKQRPSEKELNAWYTESASTAIWRKKLLQSSSASRDEKIIEPRAHWILDGLSEYLKPQSFPQIHLTDISFFGKALVEKIAVYNNGIQITSASFTESNEEAYNGHVHVKPLSSMDAFSGISSTDVVVAIDVWERMTSIHDFLAQMETVVNPGGLVFATCPVSSGFEIQSLWDRSPSIIPPDKLNLPSVKGLLGLFASSAQWKVLELSTPGMFDVELVKQTIANSPNENWPRSLHALLDTIDQQGVSLFTEYLQSQRLSSFARIVLRRETVK